MAGPVQETSPQQLATKRSAEADPEPSPVTKRPAEDPERKHQAQPMDASANAEDARAAAASKQQPTADQTAEGNAAQDPAMRSTENGKPAAEHQPEVSDAKVAKNLPPSDHSEALNGEAEAAVHAPDPAAHALQLATEAAAAQEEAQKVAKIAAQKQAEAVEALQAAAKGVPADQSTAEPVVKEASETVPAAPQESAKPTGAELSSEVQAKDVAPHAPVEPTEQKITEATPPQKELEATNETSVEVPPQQPAPVMAIPAPDTVFPPPTATLAPAPVGELPPPVADTVFPPSMETLTPANPLPQTASTPLIGNVPPQAVESLKAASQQAASVLPLQPTQELLEQQYSIRTTPLTQPVDQGVAPMEE